MLCILIKKKKFIVIILRIFSKSILKIKPTLIGSKILRNKKTLKKIILIEKENKKCEVKYSIMKI